jgi:hypothetical protein
LQSKYILNVGFEVLTAVVMNVAIFRDIVPCSPYVNHMTSIFGVKNRPSKKPVCIRWLGRISRHRVYQLYRVWDRGRGLCLPSLAHCPASLGPLYKPVGSKFWVGVCKDWFEKTDVCRKPEENRDIQMADRYN